MRLSLIVVSAFVIGTATQVLATDLRREADAVAIGSYWEGFYAGAHIGWKGTRSSLSGAFLGGTRGSTSIPGDTANGGIYVGRNWASNGPLVVGVEGDLNFGPDRSAETRQTDVTVSTLSSIGFRSDTITRSTLVARHALGLSGSLRARAGYALDQWLLYATGGLALAELRLSGSLDIASTTTTTTRFFPFSPSVFSDAAEIRAGAGKTALGYTVGGGIEYAFSRNLLGRAEYLFTDLGSSKLSVGTAATVNAGVETHSARVGLAYRF